MADAANDPETVCWTLFGPTGRALRCTVRNKGNGGALVKAAYADGEVIASKPSDTMAEASSIANRWYSSFIEQGIFQAEGPTDQLAGLTAIGHMLMRQRAPQPMDIDFLAFGMATEYLRLAIGNEWTNQVAFAQHPKVGRERRSARDYMRSKSAETGDRFRYQQRVLRLAELLANLHAVEGMDARIDDLRAGKLEDTLAELEVGAFLRRRGLEFRFITTSGTKGSDYDGELRLHDGVRVPCEIKCKVESTSATKASVLNALKAARTQLPADHPGVVYLKIPEPWLSELDTMVTPAASEFLAGTSRVVAVTIIWEQLHPAGDGAAFAYRFRLVPGRIPPKFTETAVGDLLKLLSESFQRTKTDISFHELAARLLAKGGTVSGCAR